MPQMQKLDSVTTLRNRIYTSSVNSSTSRKLNALPEQESKEMASLRAEHLKASSILCSMLFAAIRTGDVLGLNNLLKMGVNPNVRTNSQTALTHACAYPLLHSQIRTIMIKLLLEHGADPFDNDPFGTICAGLKYEEKYKCDQDAILDLFLAHIKSEDLPKLIEWIMYASIRHSNIELIWILVDRGFDIAQKINNISPLCHALRWYKTEIAQFLLIYGVNPECTNDDELKCLKEHTVQECLKNDFSPQLQDRFTQAMRDYENHKLTLKS